MKSKNSLRAKPALDIIEEALHLLRSYPAELLAGYYAGTLPFVLSLLYFWSDMSRNPFAAEYCAPAALGLALLFAWMKYRQALFCTAVIAKVSRRPLLKNSLKDAFCMAARQTFIHALGLFLLPVALLISVPFGWTYAFFQNVSAVEYESRRDREGIWRQAWEQAKLWPGQNHILLSILSVFGFFVFLNIASAIFFLPNLLKMLFGLESLFTMNLMAVLNSTFLACVCGLGYLCIDPLIKTVYALRCFYGISLKTGEDIKAELKLFTGAAVLLLCITGGNIMFPVMFPALSSAGENSRPLSRISPEELDQAISETMKERKFAWRMPREILPEKEKAEGPLADLIQWLSDGMKNLWETLREWVKNFREWMRKILPDNRPDIPLPSDSDSRKQTLYVLYALLFILGILLLLYVIRQWRKRPSSPPVESQPLTAVPDLNEENVRADALPPNEWMNLAKELAEKGEFRPALRALYLGSLARFAEFHIISIASYKSDRDYEKELSRRAHDRQPLPELFSDTVCSFQSAWYGRRAVGEDEVRTFARHQKRMMLLVQE